MRTTRQFMTAMFLLVLASFVLAGSSASAATVADTGLASPALGQVAPMPMPSGQLTPTPVYGNLGLALVVYSGGTVDDLELTAGNAGASGVWVQDSTGRYQLLPVQAPTFVKSGFAAAFPAASASAANFPQAIAVTLVAAPTPPQPTTVTQSQNGTKLTMRVGDRFLLQLGDAVTWVPQVADQTIVSRVANIAVVRGAQGVYQANQPGTTTLSATGTPPCPAGAPCALYLIQFSVTIVVLPAPGSSGIQGTVTLGPITPVCQVSVPCDSPYQATLTINNAAGTQAAQVRSGADGRYTVALPAGHYTVVPLSPQGQTLPRAATMQVDVVTGQYATVNVQYDTGIR